MYYQTQLNISEENLSIAQEASSVRESIDSFLELVVFTPKGSFKPDSDFGFEFWSNEFQNFVIKNFNSRTSDANLLNNRGEKTNKEACEKGLKKCIELYETRLKNVRIEMNLDQNDVGKQGHNTGINEIKYDVHLKISGEMAIDQFVSENYTKEIRFSVGPVIRR